jgi:hypothetical protein
MRRLNQSPTYEAMLLQALSQIDQRIAEMEPTTPWPKGDSGFRKARLDELKVTRRLVADTYRRAKALNRIAKWSLRVFLIAVPGFLAAVIWLNEIGTPIFGFLGALLILLSAVVYIGAIGIRDAIVRRRQFWRFSLRSLILVMTVTAVVLGFFAYALRK